MNKVDKVEPQVNTSEFDRITTPKLCGVRKNKILKEDFDKYQISARDIVNTLSRKNKLVLEEKERVVDEKKEIKIERDELHKYAKKAQAYIIKISSQFDQYCNDNSIVPFSLKDTTHESGYLIQKNELCITENIRSSFLEKLESIGIIPDKDQEKMLFSRTPACRITAGAGAGKSTTLAARVALLHIELGVPLEKITVCTFTRASRAEFIEKVTDIINKLCPWKEPLTEDKGKKIVRTFHSIANETYTKFGSSSRRLIYGDYTPKLVDKQGNVIDVDILNELSAEELRNIYQKDESVPQLSEVLTVTYKKLFTHDENFRKLISTLYSISLNRRYKVEQYRYDNPSENELSDKLLRDWVIENTDLYERDLKAYKADDQHQEVIKGICHLKTHFYLPNTGIRLFVSLPEHRRQDDSTSYPNSENNRNYPISLWCKWRRDLVNARANINYIWSDNIGSIRQLLINEQIASGERASDTIQPPDFAHKAVGEIVNFDKSSPKYAPIQRQLYNLSSFAYANGGKLGTCTKSHIERYFQEVSDEDQMFVKASVLFEQKLDEELAGRGLITFDQMFYELSNMNFLNQDSAILNHLRWIEHLLIDEFQDISPNIINLFCNLKRKYFSVSDLGTIMIVGDENQSLYSWRGSSSEYILDPDRYFPTPRKFEPIDLLNNYRSSSKIVSHGKQCLDARGKAKKLVAARGDAETMDSSFVIHQPLSRPKNKKSNAINYDLALEALKKAVTEDIKPTKQDPLFILSSNTSYMLGTEHPEWNEYITEQTQLGIVHTHTIHTSKGLEAESVFLIGDISQAQSNPIKNGIYRWCDIRGTYDDAQHHEKLCLLYVAITRAKNHLNWFLSKQDKKGLYEEVFQKEFNSA